jgi:YHS domain-containing protein
MHPKPGDLNCPVTMTKANAKCVWIVGGKEYQFCCPPCVDEFLIQVKKDPTTLKQPGEYVKK